VRVRTAYETTQSITPATGTWQLQVGGARNRSRGTGEFRARWKNCSHGAGNGRRSGQVSEGQNPLLVIVGSAKESPGVCALRYAAGRVAVSSTRFGCRSALKASVKFTVASRAHGKEGNVKRARKLKAIRNEARGSWVCFPIINGKRTIRKLRNLNELTQAQADVKVVEMLRSMRLLAERTGPSVDTVVRQYRTDNLAKLRHSTQRAAEVVA
jgi:hypothetical protein